MRTCLLAWIVILAVLLIGCSDGNPVETPVFDLNSPSTQDQSSNRHLLGIWKVHIDTDLASATVIPARAADMHLNAIHLLEVAPCIDCLRLENLHLLPGNVVQADLFLKHPYSTGNLKLTAFDVRAIFIGEADYTWPVSGRMMAMGDDVPRMLNPDGYTQLFNPTEFPETVPVALGYIPGNYTFGGDLTATLNPYVAFNKEEPRRVFMFHSEATETIQIKFPDGPMEFGYAVEGCWHPFVGSCTDPVEDFPTSANCYEAYELTTWSGPGLSLDSNAWTYAYATVLDHQGTGTIAGVTMEIPDLMTGQITMDFYDELIDGSYVYRARITNELGVGTGDYPFMVRVADTETDPNLGQIDAWNLGTLPVREGWAYMLGDYWEDRNMDTAINADNDIYILSEFDYRMDLDPSPGDIYESEEATICLVKLDKGEGFEWYLSWHTNQYLYYPSLSMDTVGNLYIFGQFRGVVDFDPGPGVCEKTSFYNEAIDYYEENMYLLKLGPEGDFIWAQTWFNESYLHPNQHAVDESGNNYIAGSFTDTPDFDPGTGEDEHEAGYNTNAFLLKLESDGAYCWTVTWGDDEYTQAKRIAIDNYGNPVLTGRFTGVVDMDPGPGEDWHDSEGMYKRYLSKFDPDGNLYWCRSLTLADDTVHVGVDSANNIFIASEFGLVVDFDPGPLQDIRTSNGSTDVFISMYDPDGIYQWVKTWGGIGYEMVDYMVLDNFDNIIVGGEFRYTVDFDPGPGIEEHTSEDTQDWYMSKFNSSYDLEWVAAWDVEPGCTASCDVFGNIYTTGNYHSGYIGTDMDPGPTEYYPDLGVEPDYSNIFLLKMPNDFDWL